MHGRSKDKPNDDFSHDMPRHVSFESFIARARQVHGTTYLYTNIVYLNMNTKVSIECPLHGSYQQTPTKHCSGQGCPRCGRDRRDETNRHTAEQFVEKARAVHGDTYDYALCFDTYSDMLSPVSIRCKIHGIFSQRAANHTFGKGCKKCWEDRQRVTYEEFVCRSQAVHGNIYAYSDADYQRTADKVEIVCPMHGGFMQAPTFHMAGSGCPACSVVGRTSTKDGFARKASELHDNFYDYSQVQYESSHLPVKISCPKHGAFRQTPSNHLAGKGCSGCNSRHSRAATQWLEAMAEVLDVHIMHNGNGGEFRVRPTTYRADGYCAETKTVFEFHG